MKRQTEQLRCLLVLGAMHCTSMSCSCLISFLGAQGSVPSTGSQSNGQASTNTGENNVDGSAKAASRQQSRKQVKSTSATGCESRVSLVGDVIILLTHSFALGDTTLLGSPKWHVAFSPCWSTTTPKSSSNVDSYIRLCHSITKRVPC